MELEFVFKNLYVEWLVFEWLIANEFLSNWKNISALYLHFFLHFLHSLFFLLRKFSTLHHRQRSIQSNYQEWPPKGVFFDSLEKYLGMSPGLWSSVCVWCWIFENFFENFRIVYKKTDEWYIEWQRVATSDNEWFKARKRQH